MASDNKLDIRLPEDHPLLQHPKGTRSQKAREAIDTGLAVSNNLREIKNLLHSLDLRMEKLENALETIQAKGFQSIEAEDEQGNQTNVAKFDVDAFMNLM